jgi:hypothetical protein
MAQLLCKSYFDAAEAADDLDTLFAAGHSPSEITLVVSDRGQGRSQQAHLHGLRTPSAIADVVLKKPRCLTAVGQSLKQQGVAAYEEHRVFVIVCGALAIRFAVLGGVGSAGYGLLDVLLAAGVPPNKAGHLMLDLLRGGILVAVRIPDAASGNERCSAIVSSNGEGLL